MKKLISYFFKKEKIQEEDQVLKLLSRKLTPEKMDKLKAILCES